MSRIGRAPIPVPSGVEVTIEPDLVKVSGPKGALQERIPRDITVAREEDRLVVTRPTDRGPHRALHGLTRTLVANMVIGVTDGYEKRLEIQGVGYRAQLRGRDLELALGGISKQLVGETAAIIRKKRPPEPYKGKGIRYEGEIVARKVGKRA
jgi:large subunit ribosomal protein L6